jgi:formate dehydrogenase subunit gamma
MTAAPAPWSEARATEIIDAHRALEGPLLPILHALQAEFGWISDEAVALTAERLNISRAEAHGTLTFYHDFRRAPAGRRVVKVCRAPSCQARGGEAAARQLLADLGIDWGGATDDGSISIEAVYCLGLCAVSPAALIDGEPVGRLDGPSLIAAARR